MTSDQQSTAEHRALSGFPLFSGIGSAALGELAAAGQSRTWPVGTLLFQRGDAGDHMIAVLQGRIRVSLASADGRELILRDVGRGEVLGELALLDGQERSADAQVLTECTGIVIRKADFTRIANRHPDVGLAFARHLCGLLRDTNYQMESIALYDLRMRVIRFFLFSLRQLHGEDLPPSAHLMTGLNQTDLAAVLGASRPKVNRVLQDLTSAGLLRRDGDRFVCNVAGLINLAESDLSARD
jgi:CRP-like cAMP-binding protein